MAAIAELSPLLRRLLQASSSPLGRHTPPANLLRPLLSIHVLPLTTPIFSNVAGFLSSIWDSILLAVPKKKPSYSRSRSRRLAGKGLKDLKNLNRCSACGRTKRMHTLCAYCVQNIKDMWAGRLTEPVKQTAKPKTGSKSDSTPK